MGVFFSFGISAALSVFASSLQFSILAIHGEDRGGESAAVGEQQEEKKVTSAVYCWCHYVALVLFPESKKVNIAYSSLKFDKACEAAVFQCCFHQSLQQDLQLEKAASKTHLIKANMKEV